jgi:hypothetical protein
MMNQLDRKQIGTSFKGYLYARYDQLVSVFGEPRRPEHSDNKIDVEWVIDTPHGVATIYNYKDGKAYLGEAGLKPEQICEWNVGGKKSDVCVWVNDRLQRHVVAGY